ncbi:Prp31 C terminal domain-containing protein [Thozetella sp. PMI_491]|nr:Prp31 C terminal domain-containing protein [Thozetella sp. PMI_491]
MSTLADELLQDFEDSGSEAGDDQQDNLLGNGLDANGWRPDGAPIETNDADVEEEEDQDEEMGGVDGTELNPTDDPEETKAKVEKMQLRGVRDVRAVAGLMKTLGPVLQKITEYQSQPAQANIGNIEDHPEYDLLTQANSFSTSIDSDIVVAHKFIRDHYSVRFPELETLISNPVEYARAVAILGNGPFDSDSIKALQISTNNPLGVTLKSVLDGPTLMIVTVEATTSKGQPMSQDELDRTVQACEMVLSLDKAKKILTEYVQSRMNIFAPNLTALIGSLTAAQLLNAAGGLAGLSKTPACNLPAWGSKKQANAALATNIGIRQQGFIYHSPEIRSVPTDLKKQAMRMFANKIVLAARTDLSHFAPDGSEGERLKNDCLDRIDKLQAKPLNKGARALPAPDDKPSRKRGGRRARKAKEALSMTDLRKQQNRMGFNKEEKEAGYGVGDSTVGMGMIGQRDDGRLRATQIDQRTRAKLSAKSKGWGGATSLNSGSASSLKGLGGPGAAGISLAGRSGLRTSGVGSSVNTAGTVSSLAFTPLQGLELVDPKVQAELSRKRKADEDRWFKGGTFTQVGGTGTSDDGVFKKPALPPAKRVDTGATKRAK